jgi:hypothetical protein
MKLLSFLFSILLLTCQHGGSVKAETVTYSRDSLFISYTIASWLKTNEVSWFENARYNCFNGNDGMPVVYTDTILYNQDGTKLYAIVILRRDTCTLTKDDRDSFYAPVTRPFVFDARGIIGYKDTATNLWKLYHHAPLIQQGFMEYGQLSKQTRKFFFTEFKNHSMLWLQQSDRLLYKKVAYNIRACLKMAKINAYVDK